MLHISNLIFLFLLTSCCYGIANKEDFLNYQFALVRGLSPSFENSLKLHPPPTPIDLQLAKLQHEEYVNLIVALVPVVIRIESDPNHPDCNFIEDTAIIVGDTAVISRMGALERRGEEIPIAKALNEFGMKTIHLQPPATLDGGDVLYTGKHLFVGQSSRTNEFALKKLQEIFKRKVDIIGVPVTGSLHLKSVVSLFDYNTLVVADTPAGTEIQQAIHLAAPEYSFIAVPDTVASNVLRIGSTLIVQEGFQASEEILQNACNKHSINMVKINMSELIKADGALTCGSLLFGKKS